MIKKHGLQVRAIGGLSVDLKGTDCKIRAIGGVRFLPAVEMTKMLIKLDEIAALHFVTFAMTVLRFVVILTCLPVGRANGMKRRILYSSLRYATFRMTIGCI